jgi:hypothetical protein
MAAIILHDVNQERAVLFCTTSERPLDHEAFIGSDAWDQADDFLSWLGRDPRTVARLDGKIEEWRFEAFDADDNFIGARA